MVALSSLMYLSTLVRFTKMKGSLASLSADLVGESSWASSTRWSRMISMKRKEGSDTVLDFAFKSYGKNSPKTEGAEGYQLDVVEASMGSLEMVYIHATTMQLVNYFLGFLDLQKLAMKMAEWPLDDPTSRSLFCVCLQRPVIVLNIAIQNPFILVPQNPSVEDHLVADLGCTQVTNMLYLQKEKGSPLISQIAISVSGVRVGVSHSSSPTLLPILNIPELPLKIFVPLRDPEFLFPTAVGDISIPSVSVSLLAHHLPFILSLVKEQFLEPITPPDHSKNDVCLL